MYPKYYYQRSNFYKFPVTCYIYTFLFTKTSSQHLLTTCYFLQEQVILKKMLQMQILYPKPTESETLGRDPGNQKSWMLANEDHICQTSGLIGITWKLPLVICVQVCGGGVHVGALVYAYMWRPEFTQFCFLRSCLPCVLRQFLIDLGSSIRLLVDEQAPGIFLSMSLGVQTRVLLWLTWWGVVRGTKFTFSCFLRKYFMMSISPVLYHYFLNKQFILAP